MDTRENLGVVFANPSGKTWELSHHGQVPGSQHWGLRRGCAGNLLASILGFCLQDSIEYWFESLNSEEQREKGLDHKARGRERPEYTHLSENRLFAHRGVGTKGKARLAPPVQVGEPETHRCLCACHKGDEEKSHV